MTLNAEVTEITCPPNKADQFRTVSIWIPETEDHIEFTLYLNDFQKAGLAEGDTITIKMEKRVDIDQLTRDLLGNP
ncbi:MAG: hypothetical protein COV67_09210 [Nitrospinae bacterium CG11_big_fil_rev_8_21_14_0_20_56_8]|nr:MAG: hypothetical protein COV67_09210 [Nitrospinae bacterium CG11_big_fil_rev_8_21_14_0_20_56_8]